MDLFTRLEGKTLTGKDIGAALGLHPRGTADFLDALVAMKYLAREGSGAGARYANLPEIEGFLCRTSPRYIGGIL